MREFAVPSVDRSPMAPTSPTRSGTTPMPTPTRVQFSRRAAGDGWQDVTCAPVPRRGGAVARG